jgi:dihydroorotate dehydrogenase
MTLDPARPFLISPPFGSYFRDRRAYSVLGSFTRFPRLGRTAQILRTVRPVPGGWVNKIGLRNPGAEAALDIVRLKPCQIGIVRYLPEPPKITSFTLIDGDTAEWEWLVGFLGRPNGRRPAIVEINISCPNTDHPIPALPSEAQARAIIEQPNLTTIWKLPPIESAVIEAVAYLSNAGARYFHLSNTLPIPHLGGLSGAGLREANLRIVERRANYLAQRFQPRLPRPEIIAGGGIYRPDHLRAYRDAGATRFSLATAWFWPPRAWHVMRSL